MRNNLVVGIDVGTNATRVVVAEHGGNRRTPHVLGIGKADSAGIRHGYVTNHREAIKSIRQAIARAEESSKQKIRRAYLAIGGVSLSSEIVTASLIISKADGEITILDIEKLAEKAENILTSEIKNKKIIHAIPLQYRLDAHDVLGNPIGMKGVKLEVRMLFVTTLEHHFDDLINTVTDAGIDVIDVVAAPIASGMAVLSQRQKVVGSLLVDIGAETVSIAVFENDMIISLEVFGIGSTDITNDIALGFQVGLDEAEQIKIANKNDTVSRKKLDEIIDARLSDIFELIEAHLKQIKRAGLLPAGVVITGGGSSLATIESFAKESLHLPVQVLRGDQVQALTQRKLSDPSWLVAYGLCFLDGIQGSGFRTSPFTKMWRNIKGWFERVFEQFLP